jgi:hypothetical protein
LSDSRRISPSLEDGLAWESCIGNYITALTVSPDIKDRDHSKPPSIKLHRSRSWRDKSRCVNSGFDLGLKSD